nr:immunoglobulin light chain junction region [Macaca mulatta]
CQQYSTDPYSF